MSDRWGVIFRRRRTGERDLDRELRLHLELEAEEQCEAGLSAANARYAARIDPKDALRYE
ncbi:MAG TPA: permease prefix domain 1-containing protein [Bryobacteraceae bacterium]|nr:permease prefix domain 1-containing protein [Bryobacteraceae bacterium]